MWFQQLLFFTFCIHTIQTDTVRLGTQLGSILGRRTDLNSSSYVAFLSIPYAFPPLGKRRFKPPTLARKWEKNQHNGLVDPPMCPQLLEEQVVGDEDCLVLNIFTPAQAFSYESLKELDQDFPDGIDFNLKNVDDPKPVMVFVHGGAFVKGSSSPSEYGPDFLIEKDVILVTLNYRIGVLGFFTLLNETAPGNLGLRDIIVALDWIQENIGDYGGDQNRVTIFGQSAGSMAISALITMEQAKFQRAILQSGTLVRPIFYNLEKTNRTQTNLDYAAHVGCSDSILECLQSKSIEELVSQTYFKPKHMLWEPIIDSKLKNPLFPQDPLSALFSGKGKNVDVIIGSNNGDGIVYLGDNLLVDSDSYEKLQSNFIKEGPALFLEVENASKADIVLAERLRYFYGGESVLNNSLDKTMVDLMTDNMYQSGGKAMLELLQFGEAENIYQYSFQYVGSKTNSMNWFNIDRPELGACHGDELFYIFSQEENNLLSDTDKAISREIVTYWTNFAKSGNPNGPGSVLWTPVSRDTQKYLKVAEKIEMELTEDDVSKANFWRTVYFKPQVETTTAGSIQGSYLTSVKGKCIKSFQGIPYAEPPVGHLRFLDPVLKNSWTEILDATKLGNKCMQANLKFYTQEEMSEDCLFLNIYSPCGTSQEKYPVMVYIHGGGLESGSGGTHFYGPEFLVDENVILVTINYRLSVFGFMSLERQTLPGNQGFKDQRVALNWIQNHIESFGGDKNQVTLFGQSGGSLSVLSHLSSIYSEGLFKKAIAQSSAPGDLRPVNKNAEPGVLRKTVLSLAAKLNCNRKTDEATLLCLQEVDAEEIMEASLSDPHYKFTPAKDYLYSQNPFFYVSVEDAFSSGVTLKVPLMAGFLKDEGIMNIANILQNDELLDNLNQDWDVYGTQLIFKKCCEFTNEEIYRSREVRKFYFGEQSISEETSPSLINMFSDLIIWVGMQRAIDLYSKNSPVYEYFLTYEGSYSYSELTGIEDQGVCHLDDLLYLFNPHLDLVEFPTLRTDSDKAIRDTMVKMWTNFAKKDVPVPPEEDLDFNWSPYQDSHQYLEIMLQPEMNFSDSVKERLDFWEATFPLAPRVKTQFGTMIGVWERSEQDHLYKAFKGIRYGRQTRRFQEAEPVEDFEIFFHADKEGNICPQLEGPYQVPGEMNEDCLFLNVFTPSGGENLSVMVWIHGGAFTRGSGGDYFYGPQFFIDKNIILVTLNYRLGAFGFLSFESESSPGNMGLRDQNLALKWVKNNINSFGGNPESITLFGESAGSFSVMYQVLSPFSNGLFNRAIAQSGAPFGSLISGSRLGKPQRIAFALAKALNCNTGTEGAMLTCLENKSTQEILEANYICVEDGICSVNPWDAVVDRVSKDPFLPDTPENLLKTGLFNQVQMILGVTSEEGIYSAASFIRNESSYDLINTDWDYYGPLYIFDTSEATDTEIELAHAVKNFYLKGNLSSIDNIHDIIDMFSDIFFWAGAHRFTHYANSITDIYSYLLSYKSKNSFADLVLGVDSETYGLEVCHADDLYHIFKNHVFQLTFTEDDLIVRNNMLDWWTNFAKSGKPSLNGEWKTFSASNPGYFEIKSDQSGMAYSDRYKQRMDFWMEIFEQTKA